MKLYFLVEGGQTEKRVYRSWLSHVFPTVHFADRQEDMVEDSVRIVAGKGYPQYLSRIDEVLEDLATVAEARVDHLFVCVDAEDEGFDERLREIESYLQARSPVVPYSVIIQDCCIETWFLGNRRFVRAQPQREVLRKLKAFYDVRERDPEGMPAMRAGETRARFHKTYLKEACRERRLAYSERNPGPVRDAAYLNELVLRHRETSHLASFGRLVGAWEALGADFAGLAR